MPYFWRRPYTSYIRRRWRRRPRYRWPRRRRARKTFYRRRRTRRKPTKRTRRVRRKFKKKKQFLIQKLWQPDNIRKCTIRGYMPLIACGQGRQAYDFIRHVKDVCDRNYSYGGGFAHAVFSLNYLFEEFQLFKNYWSHTNNGFDLVRYTGASIKFYRHVYADFIVSYSRSYPMTVTKLSFPSTYPLRLLLSRHRFLVPSLKSRPNMKKPYIKKKVKVPKLMSNKWFFTKDFSDVGLLHLKASVINLQGSYLKPNTDNNCCGILILNYNLFQNVGFDLTTYTLKHHIYYFKKEGTQQKAYSIKKLTYSPEGIFYSQYLLGNTTVFYKKDGTLVTDGTAVTDLSQWEPIPLLLQCRYQPARDTGEGNVVFIESTHSSNWDIPRQDEFKLENLPMYIALFGFVDWMDKYFHEAGIYDHYCIALKSKYIYGFDFTLPKDQVIIPISLYFQSGQGEYGSPPLIDTQQRWIPTIRRQLSVINDIVNTGPYSGVPQGKGFDLPIEYKFYFKWGGTVVNLQNIQDPSKQETFPVPRDQFDRIQIKNPAGTQSAEFHYWDYRRGILTKKALKRVLQDSADESLSSTDSEELIPKKRHAGEPEVFNQEDSRTHQVLKAYEECLSKEKEKTPDLQQLHKQQLHFQRQLLRMICQLQQKQRDLSIMTGQLE
nr:MAG: ORF1 [Torque teno midi virus]UHM26286.1 MAG: ORF1 [Torque teno midi virus]